MNNDNMRVWHWTELLQVKNRIDKRMLITDGMIVEVSCYIKGESPRTIPPKRRLVKLDRDYVVNKLSDLIAPIKDAPETLIADLLQEALFLLTNKQDGQPTNATEVDDED